MVIRILTGKNVADAVRYNEKKVSARQAERIQIANYPNPDLAMRNAGFRLHLLEHQARLNPAIQKSAVHLAVAFHPEETLTNEQVRLIGNRVMREAGYGSQPYLMYRHHDTDHPHIHIVTVAVDGNGRKINDSYIKTRLNKIRRGLELEYGLLQAEGQKRGVAKQAGISEKSEEASIADVVRQAITRFTFGSIGALEQYLAVHGVGMSFGAGRSGRGVQYQKLGESGPTGRPIAASALEFKPTFRKIQNQIVSSDHSHQRNREVVAQTIRQQLNRFLSLSEFEFKQALRQAGIQVLEGKDGYMYVQERIGAILLDTELERPFWKASLQERFTQTTERRPLGHTSGIGQNVEGQGRLKQKATKSRVDELQAQAGEKKAKLVVRRHTQPVDKERETGFDRKVVAADVSNSNPQPEPTIQPAFNEAPSRRTIPDQLKKNSRKKGPRL